MPGTDAVDPARSTVTIDGADVDLRGRRGVQRRVQRTSMLAIDTSTSMAGQRIAEAKKAALTYLDTVPDNVKVGVVTFDNTVEDARAADARPRRRDQAPSPASRLTLQHRAVRRRARRHQGDRSRGEDAGQRQILVLSDGKDTTDADLADVLDAIKKSGVSVDVVSLAAGRRAPTQPLNEIASAGKGTVLTTADPAALTAAFASEADALARQILVTATVPAGSRRPAPTSRSRVPTGSADVHRRGVRPRAQRRRHRGREGRRGGARSRSGRPAGRLQRTSMYGARRRHRHRPDRPDRRPRRRRPEAGQQPDRSTEQIQAYGVMAVPGQAGPAPRRRGADGARRAGPPGRREGAGQQQGPRGPDRAPPRGRRPGT